MRWAIPPISPRLLGARGATHVRGRWSARFSIALLIVVCGSFWVGVTGIVLLFW